MADPKTITQLTERSGALQATDEIEVQVSGETTTKKKALSAVKTLVIGSATIGGNAAGDIVTTNGTQTLTNKTLTSPTVGTACTLPAATTIGTVTAAEILKLAGLTPSTAELNYVDGVTSPIQTQINDITVAITERVYSYGVTFVAAGTSADEITQATIMTGAGVPSGYIINPIYVMVQMSTVSGNKHTKIDEVTAPVAWEITTDGSGTHLVKIKPTLVNGTTYNIAVTFRVTASLT